MANKILVLEPDKETREQLEQILKVIVEEGGEVFFAKDNQTAFAIFEKEHPRLVFLEERTASACFDEWKQKKAALVFLCERSRQHEAGGDVLFKPLKPHAVLEVCRSKLQKQVASFLPPM